MTQTALTREQVLALKSGNNLDLIVAIEVLGHEPGEFKDGWIKLGPKFEGCPKRYSTDMSAAWEVTEQMRKTHWSTLDSGLKIINRPEVKPFSCSFGKYGIPGTSVYAEANKAPEAICKAALLAVLDL